MSVAVDVLSQAGTSVVGAVLLVAARSAAARWRWRDVHRFWGRYRHRDLDVMTTEYKVKDSYFLEGHESTQPGITVDDLKEQLIAVSATSGYLVSYATQISLSLLQDYFHRRLRIRVHVMGDKNRSSGGPHRDRNLLVLGNPAVNRYLDAFFDDFCREHPLLREFRWSIGMEGVTLTLPSGERLEPAIDKTDSGSDYALVVCLRAEPTTGRQTTIVSACNMWGAEAAIRLLLDPRLIRQLPSGQLPKGGGFAFLIRAGVFNGGVSRVGLYPTNEDCYVFDLTRTDRPDPGR